MVRVAASCALLFLGSASITGCDATGKNEAESPPRPGKRETSTSRPPAGVQAAPIDEPLPTTSQELATTLRRTHTQLIADIDAWLSASAPLTGSSTRQIRLGALLEQRIYRKLGRNSPLARKVASRLERPLLTIVRRNVAAERELNKLVVPRKPGVRLKTSKPRPPHELLRLYQLAERRFGVPWEVLAAINLVESRFGRVLGPSTAGALGPMQFLPSTWAIYGRGKDIMDPRDSVLGAARYLRASGAPADLRGALFAYNPSDAYVDAILLYAREMRRDLRSYYAYYFWQVFVTTTRGDVQLTGPGADQAVSRKRAP